ncbi:hypothetical protein WDU94_010911 [Cyamophila willieti]
MAAQLFKLAKNNLFFLVNDLKPTYRNEEVTTENVHVINGAASDVSQALDKYDKALEDYVAALSEDSSVNSEDDENSVMSCRRFLRLLNAKLAKFAENCEEKRADEMRLNEEKRADERARLELESRERIEMERIRLAATAGTMADTATATTANTSNLPKINLQTFGGDVTRFQEFWDCFNAAVDCSTSHFFGNCPVRNKTKCYYCKRVGHHNSAICPKQFGKVRNANHSMNSVRHTSTVSKELSDNKIVPSKSLVAVDSENTRSTEESCSISNSGEMTLCAKAGIQTRVYLQTATIKVFNPKTNEIQKVRAVLDSGATSSYISQQLFDSLGLKRDYTKQVNVYTFGQSSSKSMVVQGAKIAIEDKVGKRYNLEVSVVPTIVGNTKREVCEIEWIRELNKQYALADEYYEAGNDESFHLLLGNDYYSSIMLDCKKIQILENMYLVNTVFGYVLSGKNAV